MKKYFGIKTPESEHDKSYLWWISSIRVRAGLCFYIILMKIMILKIINSIDGMVQYLRLSELMRQLVINVLT